MKLVHRSPDSFERSFIFGPLTQSYSVFAERLSIYGLIRRNPDYKRKRYNEDVCRYDRLVIVHKVAIFGQNIFG